MGRGEPELVRSWLTRASEDLVSAGGIRTE